MQRCTIAAQEAVKRGNRTECNLLDDALFFTGGRICCAPGQRHQTGMDLLVCLLRLGDQGQDRESNKQNDEEKAYKRHGCTSQTCSKRLAGSWIPEARKRSSNVGRSPVARKRPSTRLLGLMPSRSKTKMSCSVTMSSLIPVTSETWVMRRVPSLSRATCTIKETADVICCRMARSGRFNSAINDMVSRREIASRGLLA